jgi:hypothetical protein
MALHDRALLVGQNLGFDLVDTDRACDGLCGRPIVAGEHNGVHTVGLGYGERFGRRPSGMTLFAVSNKTWLNVELLTRLRLRPTSHV